MILINGNFLCRALTGIERFAFEVCSALDEIVGRTDKVSLFAPRNAKQIPAYKNIGVILSKKPLKSFPVWDVVLFARECKRRKAVALDFSNTAPLGRLCGIAFLHDIYAKDCPQDFLTLKEKLIREYSLLHYKNIAHNAKKVLTVSQFSKQRIQEAYGTPSARIEVIPNGWEHFARVESDGAVFEKFPALKKGDYFFTLGSISKRKNLKWIAQCAQKSPHETFAVSGKAISGLVPKELEDLRKLDNVILLGYVSDGEVKALMQGCKAFVFPSYYEGFGIPPLEALSCGAKVVCSRSASIPEVCADAVNYINPFDANCDLSRIIEKPVSPPDEVLAKYTYRQAAAKLKSVLLS